MRYKFLLLFISLSSSLTLAEYVLRKSGTYPGMMVWSFHAVDSFECSKFRISDSLGINKHPPLMRVGNGFDMNTNADGFSSPYLFDRSTTNSLHQQGRTVVAFIGDSYTEGYDARPFDSCFVGLIDNTAGYAAYNLGIGGTDPLQYELVAKNYLPRLMPDICFVVFYYNDFLPFFRKPSPGVPIYYTTNAGWIQSQKPLSLGYAGNDLLTTPEEAYRFYLKNYSIVGTHGGGFWKVFSYSSILTAIYNALYPMPDKTATADLYASANYHATRIKSFCDSLQIPCYFLGVPDAQSAQNEFGGFIEEHDKAFHGLKYYFPRTIGKGDSNGHYNNQGHKKYANFVLSLLNDSLSDSFKRW